MRWPRADWPAGRPRNLGKLRVVYRLCLCTLACASIPTLVMTNWLRRGIFERKKGCQKSAFMIKYRQHLVAGILRTSRLGLLHRADSSHSPVVVVRLCYGSFGADLSSLSRRHDVKHIELRTQSLQEAAFVEAGGDAIRNVSVRPNNPPFQGITYGPLSYLIQAKPFRSHLIHH